jgi:exodeoxyribonuclease-5
MNVTVNDLSSDQRDAYDTIVRWVGGSHDEPAVLSLGGYAGSGKSTLVSLVAAQVDLPAFCAFTGKATSVLRRKLRAAGIVTVGAQKRIEGVPFDYVSPFCGTIHSLIYQPCECLELSKSSKEFEELKGPDGKCMLCHGDEWTRRGALDRDYGLIIVDEASMVDDSMLSDLREFGVPILAVGDHGQLPPVRGTGSLMMNPNLRLERIHRQAEGNPIIALSKVVRETGRLPETMPENEHVWFGQLRFVEQFIERCYSGASAERLLELGMACYTNKRRVGLNAAVRRARGTAGGPPREGEHVVCLRNMKGEGGRMPVANGMRGVLQSDAVLKKTSFDDADEPQQISCSIAFPEDEIRAHVYTLLSAQFGREKTFQGVDELKEETGFRSFQSAGCLFDFGYGMTVHKMQGSSVSDLVVCVERPGPVDDESWRRWLYTAVTRSSNRLSVLR